MNNQKNNQFSEYNNKTTLESKLTFGYFSIIKYLDFKTKVYLLCTHGPLLTMSQLKRHNSESGPNNGGQQDHDQRCGHKSDKH